MTQDSQTLTAYERETKLRKALKDIIGLCADRPDLPDNAMTGLRVSYGELRSARSALNQGQDQ